jgi:hypothetical protein
VFPSNHDAGSGSQAYEEIMMRYYNQPHQFYCGIDLHASSMYLCILDHAGQIVLHKDLPTQPDAFLEAIAPFRADLVVCCECLFCWYWLADLCHDENIAFVLGHALYMRAIYGVKTKDDKIDSEKIARLLRGGNLPYAYAYPKGLRETRDLLRRRMYLVRKRAELITHVINTNTQYNLPPFGKKLMYARNRKELNICKRFTDPSVRTNIELDLRLLDTIDELINDVELYLTRTVKVDHRKSTSCSTRFQAWARSWPWYCSTRSTISAALPTRASSCPTPG